MNPYDDDSAWAAIQAAREWQENAEMAIPAEIVEDLISELEPRLRPPVLADSSTQISTVGG